MRTIQEQEAQYIINTYNRQPDKTPCLVKGEGSYLWDEKGRKYIDFLCGLAVNIVGHCHPEVVHAIQVQAALLMHTSNLYYSEPQVNLARELVKHSMAGKVFFANSGAEANEAAIKLVRKNRPDRYKIITAHRSFHGRTLATLTATGQPKYQRAFEPLVEGFSYACFNDLKSFEALIDAETAAIMIEPVQGEGGVYTAEKSFILGLRELCDRHGMLLIFDEVQCGMGRTGKLWAYENWDAKPDLLTAAKGLGGGLPIGALLVSEPYAAVLQPGDHASTFGGNPVVCQASLAVLGILLQEGFLGTVLEKGLFLKTELTSLAAEFPHLIDEYRGIGMICALELKQPLAGQIKDSCCADGLLINAIGETTLRFLPPLTITVAELAEGLAILKKTIYELKE
ncbi:MAG TPA: aspartate aminotransferase family protein [Candidatus Limnocylindrales bacterium]|nr:aspartate aminotransferase family protein [Candidatus Limnocylindrales bacterium]